MKKLSPPTKPGHQKEPDEFTPLLELGAEVLIRKLTESEDFAALLAELVADRPLVPDYITAKQLAELFQVSATLVNRLRRDEGMPHLMVGCEPRYNPKACFEWFRERTERGAA